MLIPTHFYIGKKKYMIYIDNAECQEALGLFYESDREIYLADNYQGKKQSKIEIEKTLLHEITHALLTSMGKFELSQDEEFVDGLAIRLHQVLKYLYPTK